MLTAERDPALSGTTPTRRHREHERRNHMSNPRLVGLPADHPFKRAAGRTPAQLAADIVAYHRGRTGLSMKLVGGVEVPDDDPRPADPPEGAPDPNATVTIDGREWKIGDLQRLAADEKRQGKRAGQREVLEQLGVTDLDAAKALIASAQEQQRKDETEAQRKQREADEKAAAADREKAIAAEERRAASLERALIRRGVGDADLDDAVALLQKQLGQDADADAIAAEADKLKERRAELFDGTVDDGRPPAAQIPPGRTGNPPRPRQAVFGQGGLARAEKRWGKKTGTA
jgi:hypothetical protein